MPISPERLARRAESARKWREQNPDRVREYSRTYAAKNREKRRLYAERHNQKRRADPDWKIKRRDWELRNKYGMSSAEFDTLLCAQGGVCGICGGPPLAKGYVVDHDHLTGKVRGILCSRCNTAIGLLRDSPTIAQKVVAYLERSRDGA